jgi:hypothetical protein
MFNFNPFPSSGPNACVFDGVASLQCITNVFPVILSVAITFAFIACLVLIVYSGVKFITSGGDEKQVEGAKKTLTYSIIGMVVVLSSFFIVQLIARQTGVECLTKFGFENCRTNPAPTVPPGAKFCDSTHPCIPANKYVCQYYGGVGFCTPK